MKDRASFLSFRTTIGGSLLTSAELVMFQWPLLNFFLNLFIFYFDFCIFVMRAEERADTVLFWSWSGSSR